MVNCTLESGVVMVASTPPCFMSVGTRVVYLMGLGLSRSTVLTMKVHTKVILHKLSTTLIMLLLFWIVDSHTVIMNNLLAIWVSKIKHRGVLTLVKAKIHNGTLFSVPRVAIMVDFP